MEVQGPAFVKRLGDSKYTGAVLASVISVQIGAGIAGRLFDAIGPSAVVMFRQGFAAIVLLAFSRPRLRGRSRAEWTTIATFGLVLSAMNVTFYEAVERLPLGLAVTIELLGPLALAAFSSKRLGQLGWVALALVGVVMFGQYGGKANAAGVVFALIAAVGWATYIITSRRAGADSAGVDVLALAMLIAAVAVAPLGLRAGSALLEPRSLGLGAMVAILSGVVPFSLELFALRHVPPRVFGVLMSLSPAAAALSGLVVLGEAISGRGVVAMGLVTAASIGTVRGN